MRGLVERLRADAAFGVVRDATALAELPAGERETWERLWAKMARLSARVRESTRG